MMPDSLGSKAAFTPKQLKSAGVSEATMLWPAAQLKMKRRNNGDDDDDDDNDEGGGDDAWSGCNKQWPLYI